MAVPDWEETFSFQGWLALPDPNRPDNREQAVGPLHALRQSVKRLLI